MQAQATVSTRGPRHPYHQPAGRRSSSNALPAHSAQVLSAVLVPDAAKCCPPEHEVRKKYTPVFENEPAPEDDATPDWVRVVLEWRRGPNPRNKRQATLPPRIRSLMDLMEKGVAYPRTLTTHAGRSVASVAAKNKTSDAGPGTGGASSHLPRHKMLAPIAQRQAANRGARAPPRTAKPAGSAAGARSQRAHGAVGYPHLPTEPARITADEFLSNMARFNLKRQRSTAAAAASGNLSFCGYEPRSENSLGHLARLTRTRRAALAVHPRPGGPAETAAAAPPAYAAAAGLPLRNMCSPDRAPCEDCLVVRVGQGYYEMGYADPDGSHCRACGRSLDVDFGEMRRGGGGGGRSTDDEAVLREAEFQRALMERRRRKAALQSAEARRPEAEAAAKVIQKMFRAHRARRVFRLGQGFQPTTRRAREAKVVLDARMQRVVLASIAAFGGRPERPSAREQWRTMHGRDSGEAGAGAAAPRPA